MFLLLYVLYCVMMYHNAALERWANTLPLPLPDVARRQPPAAGNPSPMTYKNLDEESAGRLYTEDSKSPGSMITSPSVDGNGPSAKKEEEPVNIWERPQGTKDLVIWAICLPLKASAHYTMPNCRLEKWRSWFLVSFFLSMFWISVYSYVMVWMITIIGNISSIYISSTLWIPYIKYLPTVLISLIGFTLGIPDTVMGLTFVAAGVSIPDILTSLAVAREGNII